jgi:hypothetical protein
MILESTSLKYERSSEQVFKHHSKANDPEMSVFVSFGGLLMHLRGDESNLSKLDLDSRIYILIRKN